MRDSYKRVLAMLGAQAGAFVLVFALGGFAKVGRVPEPPTPVKTVIQNVPSPVVSTSISYIVVPGANFAVTRAIDAVPIARPGPPPDRSPSKASPGAAG